MFNNFFLCYKKTNENISSLEFILLCIDEFLEFGEKNISLSTGKQSQQNESPITVKNNWKHIIQYPEFRRYCTYCITSQHHFRSATCEKYCCLKYWFENYHKNDDNTIYLNDFFRNIIISIISF